MQTEIVSGASESGLGRAAELLRKGEVVALPTETVYGLAADATNAMAIAKIFEAKERPRFDPLIIHLPATEWLSEIAYQEKMASELADKFWPGPLTILLRKRPSIPAIVTADLDTVAVRLSANPIFAKIISRLARPLAAPSANRFGHISATRAEHVLEELGGRIPLIVDGGATHHGIESTIIRVVDSRIEILRRGPITAEMLGEVAPVILPERAGAVVAPGQLPSHYAPRTKLMLVENWDGFRLPAGSRIGLLLFGPTTLKGEGAVERQLSESADLREAAANFFRMLRELDRQELDLIVAPLLPETGLGAAINERLRRAAG